MGITRSAITENNAQAETMLSNRRTDGQLIASRQRTVHFAQVPVRAELVRDASYLVADGIHPPLLAFRL